VGDILFADTGTSLAKLAGVAVGNALISGGVAAAPSYGKIGLATHVDGTLPVASGGTGATSLTANNVVIGNGTSAVQFVAPGTTGNVLTSNGTTWTSAAAGGGFPSGTLMLFAQTTAPTGWTKSVTHDNKALRVVSGTASSGGSVAFTTAFVSQGVTGTIANQTATNQAATQGGTVGNTTLGTGEIPSHAHGRLYAWLGTGSGGSNPNPLWDNKAGGPTFNTNNTGGGGAHGHSFSGSSHNHTQDAHTHTFTGTAINLAVQYVDVIIAAKD
jgi:hypothetical protein